MTIQLSATKICSDEIPFSYRDSFSRKTIREGFKAAQLNYLPYYTIAFVEFKKKREDDSKELYHLYEGGSFYSHMQIETKESGKCTCSCHTFRIKTMYYIALDCFKFDQKNLFTPLLLEDSAPNFKIFQFAFPFHLSTEYPKPIQKKIDTLFIESLSMDDKTGLDSKVGYKQFWIANLIREQVIFPKFSFENREIEETKWLWCSYQSPACTLKTIIILGYKCLSNYEEWNLDSQTIGNLVLKKHFIPLSQSSLNHPKEVNLNNLSKL